MCGEGGGRDLYEDQTKASETTNIMRQIENLYLKK